MKAFYSEKEGSKALQNSVNVSFSHCTKHRNETFLFIYTQLLRRINGM
jgi:hypothetical protein